MARGYSKHGKFKALKCEVSDLLLSSLNVRRNIDGQQ